MIIIKLMGGLGNQMFQYAFGRSLSRRIDMPFKLDLNFLLDRKPRENFVFRDFDLPIFRCDLEIATKEDITQTLGRSIFQFKQVNKILPVAFRKYYTERHFHFDENILQLGKSIYLEGYWQSYRYFQNIESEIRNDFKIEDNLSHEVELLKRRIESVNSVCVNVRRGDFLVNSFHGVCGMEYYEKGVNYLSEKLSELNLFVFSDDLDWCKENMKFNCNIHFVDHNLAGEKFRFYLMLMSSCKYFIIPNSTFGWWAAWLSNYHSKIVIAPKMWLADSTINTSDLIPTDWIRL
jgi:hypothetical protein